ncbi:MAG: hypothetical protein LBL44_03395 [Treponema sp.]|jgi:hypothetical protein|nr:hypothetical protein [Treponema sp.]
MKKIINIVLLLISGSLLVTAQEVPSRVIKEIPYYDLDTLQQVGILQSDEVVYTQNYGEYYHIGRSVQISTFNVVIRLSAGGDCRTYAEGLAPLNTISLFEKDIIINYKEIINPDGVLAHRPNEMWVPSYYCDVLRSKDRETLIKFEPHLLQYNTEDTFEFGVPARWYLHRPNHISSGMSMFYNSLIYIGGYSFLIKNIEKTEYGYTVNCYGPKGERYVVRNASPNFNWSFSLDKEVALLLYVDGEYIDMYINDISQKFGTLARVKEEFIRQYENLLETNICDLANVIWPRRADGSMDYPPPQLTQAVPEQPETAAIDTPAGDGDAVTVTPVEETVAQQPGLGLSLTIVLAVAGIAIAAGVVFMIRRKK